jgi:hypothetical protein
VSTESRKIEIKILSMYNQNGRRKTLETDSAVKRPSTGDVDLDKDGTIVFISGFHVD